MRTKGSKQLQAIEQNST